MAIVVDNPIIGSPFDEPARHYRLSQGIPLLEAGRRPSGFTPGLRTSPGASSLLEEEYVHLPLVNLLRDKVRAWRQSGYPGATRTTAGLLAYWANHERERRLFFCQIEAAETAIWLVEGPLADRAHVPIEQQESYVRHCVKMATGSGKTVVMAMLIAWSVLNKARHPQDRRFSDAILVVCPNLTVKERLAVLKPSLDENFYSQFDLIPAGQFAALLDARILITNWHVFAPRDDARRRSVIQRGQESGSAFARRILQRELGSKTNLLVLNDEAHHAWRGGRIEDKPLGAPARTAGDLDHMPGAADEEDEARIWLSGLALIHEARGINRAIDFSATPYYLSGSGRAEGEPFGWITSDFSLLDAIECGMVKVPRIPLEDNAGELIPRYLDLWERVRERLPKRIVGDSSHARADAMVNEVAGALATLASAWKLEFDRWHAEDRPVPPAMIVICDQTINAERLSEYIGTAGAVLPELRNSPGQTDRTMRIDSALLSKAEEGLESTGSKELAAEALRKRVATVGRAGEPGGEVRCVVSVSMLSEGWDARNVTQILGLRAFSSQLLCEQVVGRGLRRYSYDDMSVPEYVDVYGIPFQAFPVKGERRGTSSTPPKQTLVQPLPDRREMAIRFPRVVGYISDARFRITADVVSMPRLLIDPSAEPTEVVVGDRAGTGRTTHERAAWYEAHRLQRTVFEIAARITDALKHGDETGRRVMFPQVVRIVRSYVDMKVDLAPGAAAQEIGLPLYRTKIEERVAAAIRPAEEEGESPLLPILDDIAGTGSTDVPSFMTIRECVPTERSHLSYAVCDSSWEVSVSYALDSMNEVRAWVKNYKLGFEIPYQHEGERHAFTPDFVVDVSPEGTFGEELVLVEVKGQEREQDRSKDSGALRWIAAVNHWGRLGHWRYAKIYSASDLPKALGIKH